MPSSSKPRRLLIDTDCGIDDAIAILMAFQSTNWDVKALFAVQGNADVDHVVNNVRYLSTLVPVDNDTKLYRGCSEPLIRHKQPVQWDGHGAKGLGNVNYNEFDMKTALKCEEQHAVPAIVSIVKEDPGVHDLITLGPLTNIALAIKLYPEFIGGLKSLWIMGGQESKGNCTALTEFNFRADPEAAKIVLDAKYAEKIRVVTWDCTTHSTVLWTEYEMLIKSLANKLAKFLYDLYGVYYSKYHFIEECGMCDGVAMWCMMNEKECEIVDRKMMVEVGGDVARGALAIDHYGMLINDSKRAHSKLVTRPPSRSSFKQKLNALIGEQVFQT